MSIDILPTDSNKDFLHGFRFDLRLSDEEIWIASVMNSDWTEERIQRQVANEATAKTSWGIVDWLYERKSYNACKALQEYLNSQVIERYKDK